MDFSLAMKCDGGLEEGELGYNLLRLNKNLTFKTGLFLESLKEALIGSLGYCRIGKQHI